MSLLASLDAILQESTKAREKRSIAKESFRLREKHTCQEKGADEGKDKEKQDESVLPAEMNLLAKGDNLKFMDYLAEMQHMSGKIDFIYIDPPFFSKANYMATTRIKTKKTGETLRFTGVAYEDIWENGVEEYLSMMSERLVMMRELLKDSGCIFIHLDWHIVHYVKVMADSIFGAENFLNEIIWSYKSGGAGKRYFGRKHDTILFYAKTKAYTFYLQKEKSYNRGLRPYNFKGVEEFQDELGWYTMVNMKDVWQIDMVGRTAGERVDYATQKPEALLERMIQSCTRPGDICADFFAGSGTLAAVAERMGRRWICCDESKPAIAQIQKRLHRKEIVFAYYEQSDHAFTKAKEQKSRRADAVNGKQEVKIRTCLVPGREESETKLRVFLEVEKEHMIDYWSIDYHFQDVHNPQVYCFRDGDVIQTCVERKIGGSGKISIKLTDITGDVRYEVIAF